MNFKLDLTTIREDKEGSDADETPTGIQRQDYLKMKELEEKILQRKQAIMQ